jgi:hypothetical protein
MSDTKEQVYDERISPLVAQIIAICKEAGIPVHASFALDGDLACTTHVFPEREDVPDDDLEAYDAWTERYEVARRSALGGSPPVLMITTRDSSGRVTRSEAVL